MKLAFAIRISRVLSQGLEVERMGAVAPRAILVCLCDRSPKLGLLVHREMIARDASLSLLGHPRCRFGVRQIRRKDPKITFQPN